VSKASHLSGGSGGATTATYPRLVSRRHQRALVSIGTTICVVFAAAAPLVPGSHREPPGYALESSVVLYLERLLAAFLISYVVFVIIIRSLIRGELPSTMSREGLTWSKDPSGATEEAIQILQEQLDVLEHDVNEIIERAALRDDLP
jgi:hypothetical protein